ncbi:hypothetical protein L3X38_011221 [Prunus dulcis]|uniref:Uncharacterized protein n=1 Tax=Prunus dulcis TaxID=3755 RepID=A0AAD4ZEV0_PRUDU|nr:hypothetical protein L3X38_011221 [Prunus dulcis]
MLVPGLEENLLSVGQIMEHGNFLVFGKGMVTIFDDWALQNPIAKVQMTSNRCFPLTMVPATQLVLRASVIPLVVNEKLCKDNGSEAANERSEDDMRSTSGYAFTLGLGMVSWASIKQNTVALSTAEAEYVSAAEATSQAKWLRFVLEDFEDQIADILTKALPKDCFVSLRSLLGVKSAKGLEGSVGM